MKSNTPGGNFEGWFGVLEICRSLGPKRTVFKFADLQRAAKFKDVSDDTSGLNVASLWCTKLAKWGYLTYVGDDDTYKGPGRRPHLYRVSKKGWNAKDRPGKVARLIRAVRTHQAACAGQRIEAVYASLKDLVELCDKIERNKECEDDEKDAADQEGDEDL